MQYASALYDNTRALKNDEITSRVADGSLLNSSHWFFFLHFGANHNFWWLEHVETDQMKSAHHFNSACSLRGVVTAAMIHDRLQEKIECTWQVRGMEAGFQTGGTKGPRVQEPKQ